MKELEPLDTSPEIERSFGSALRQVRALLFLSNIRGRSAGRSCRGLIARESAEAIAETARKFGQDDDETVLSGTRTANQRRIRHEEDDGLSPSIDSKD